SRTIGEIVIPYDVDKIQRDTKWFTADTVRIAMGLYRKFGLIYEEMDGTLVLSGHDSLVGSETNWAAQKRNQAKAESSLPPPPDEGGINTESEVENLHPDIRYKRLDTRVKSIETGVNKKNVSAERSSDRSTPEPCEPSIFDLPLNDGTIYGVTQTEIDKYAKLYPAVDVPQEIRNMIGWLDANPTKRKTQSGIRRFANNWLSKTQNQGGSHKTIQASKKVTTDDEYRITGNPFAG
ncbi:MAG: hypothetical protein RR337_12165, partial [Clostridia bacterium]